MPKHSNAGGGVKSKPSAGTPHPFPNNVNFSAMRSDAHGKDDSKNWSISSQHQKMRDEAHSNNKDHSNLPIKNVFGDDKKKGN